jgi:hypothetical protein
MADDPSSEASRIVTLHPLPSPKGEGPSPNALRQRRFRNKRKAVRRNAHVTSEKAKPAQAVRPVVTVTGTGIAGAAPVATAVTLQGNAAGNVHRHRATADMAAYVAAIALAGAAAWFSIKGMVVLFPGAPMAVVAMAVAMETAKLVTAGWLARRWRTTAWIWRLVLVVLVAGLAVINAAGVYAQLVAAHVGERGAAVANVSAQDAALAARIDVQGHVVADLVQRIAQIDVAVNEAARRGKTAIALQAIEGQRRSRAAIVDERKKEAGTLVSLQTERAAIGARGRQIETEAAPIRYVAAVFGVADQETAIRWLILMMALCCDPLAIALTAAASATVASSSGRR